MKLPLIYLNADTDTGSAPAPAAIPAESSPTGMDIPAAPSREPAQATVVQEMPKSEPVKQHGIVNPRKALGLDESPAKLVEKEAKQLREKLDSGRTIIPVPKIKSKKVESASVEQEQQEPEPVKVEAQAPAKVKLGDKEMTADEIAARMEELERKAKDAEEKASRQQPQARQEEPEPDVDPAQVEEYRKAQEEQFLSSRAQEVYGLDEDELDTILSGGEEAVQVFSKHLAKVELNARKWVEATLNPILQDLHESISPVVQMHQQVNQYQTETNFMSANPDLAPHQKLVRSAWSAMEQKYPREFGALSQEQKFSTVADNVRSIIRELGVQAPAPAAPAPLNAPVQRQVPAPAAPKPRPQPPTGQMGGQRAPGRVSDQASMIARLMQSGK